MIRSLLMHHIYYVARHRDEILRNINNALLERLSCCCVLINQYNEVKELLSSSNKMTLPNKHSECFFGKKDFPPSYRD
jgi:hypothetical protein